MRLVLTFTLLTLFASVAIAGQQSNRVNVPLDSFDTGDLLFTCLSPSNEMGTKDLQTIGIHYIGGIQEVTFNHTGPNNVMSDGWLRAPIKSVFKYDENSLPRWEIIGEGLFNKRRYSFTATVKDKGQQNLVADFKISSGNITMGGTDCIRHPPRPFGYLPRSLQDQK